MTSLRQSTFAPMVKKFVAIMSALFALSAPLAKAALPSQGSSPVVYDPASTKSVEGDQPLHYWYDVTVKSPDKLPTLLPTVVVLTSTVMNAPNVAAQLAAATYVTFSVPALTFTGPSQSQVVRVTLDVPVGSSTGDFQFRINTVGWPVLGTGGVPITDNGTYINMHVDPPKNVAPPTVLISSPIDGSDYTYTTGGDPVVIPISVIGTASNAAPVLSLTAEISAADFDDQLILPYTPLNLALTPPLAGTALVQGFLQLPVSTAGVYTISAIAENAVGASTDSVEFTVHENVPAPTVVINTPVAGATFSYVRGVTSTTVPYTITATSKKDGIVTLVATLDGNPIGNMTVNGLTQLVATGSGSFTFDSTVVNGLGTHVLAVTATDNYGQASTSTNFIINETVPAITTTITAPIDGVSIPLPMDASPLNVPFAFNSAVTLGANVTGLTLTLDGDTVPFTSSGLNKPTVNGTGVLTNVQPGTYTLNATGTNDSLGLSASDSTTFTVTPPPPPTIAITTGPQATYTVNAGATLTIPFTFKTTGTGAYIKTQSATLDGNPVTITSTANGTALITTGSGTLSVDTTVVGTGNHTLVVNGTDVYGQSATTQTTFALTVNAPVIGVVINNPNTTTPFTLPTTGALTIPFKFTGTINTGFTVDTLTGQLGTTPVAVSSTTGLGTSSTATASGNLSITTAGTYTLTATATNTATGISATTSTTFVVQKAQTQTTPPLTVAITQPPAPSYTLVNINNCNSLSIPVTFTGTSGGGKVKTLTATLDGQAITASVVNLGTSLATGTSTLSVRTAGQHVLAVTTTDYYGQTASTSTTFTVVVQAPAITINITSPADGAAFVLPNASGSYCGGSTSSLSIPFTFVSNITTGATIDTVSATLNGSSITVSNVSGLGTASVTGRGTFTVTRTGSYVIGATARNRATGISASTSITINVVKPTPPTVVITAPTQTSYVLSGSGGYCGGYSTLSVPFTFVGTSSSGGITRLSATLDGNSVSISSSGIGSLKATGNGTMGLRTTGQHILSVTATDANGSATAKLTITVTSAPVTPTIDISKPLDGASYSYVRGDCPPSIPFSFTAKTSSGATISSLKASVNSNSVSVCSSGLGTTTATGTGTINVSCAGTYTLTASAVSNGVTVTDKVTFTVVQTEPVKTCSVEWLSSACCGTAQRGGCYIPLQFQVRSRTGSCDTVCDRSVRICIYEVYSDGRCSSTNIYDSSDYSINYRNQYCLNFSARSGTHRYHMDVYCFPSGSNKPELIGTKDFNTY